MIFLRLITLILTAVGAASLRTGARCPADTPTCDGGGLRMCRNQGDVCARGRQERKLVKRLGLGACGPCRALPPGVACLAGEDQCAGGEYCAVDEGRCRADASPPVGRCSPLGGACDRSFEPVCGCDGRTYSNAGCANAAGKNVAGEGECKPSCSFFGTGEDTCKDRHAFCRIAKGGCEKKEPRPDGHAGYCDSKPTVCSGVVIHVCGCDGNTYSNECAARAKGVNVVKKGEC